jgi:hypothetical protein
VSASNPTGTALAVSGASTFDGVSTFTGTSAFNGVSTFSLSGTATVPAGKSSLTVTKVSLRAASLVLATIQQAASGYYVASAVPTASSSTIVLHLNKTVASDITGGIRVAWFVVN